MTSHHDIEHYGTPLALERVLSLRARILRRLGLPPNAPAARVGWALDECAVSLPHVHFNRSSFSVRELCERIAQDSPLEYYVWYEWNDIVAIDAQVIDTAIRRTWVEGRDDFTFFDATVTWLVELEHDGILTAATFPVTSGE